jgi:hypothetical protein
MQKEIHVMSSIQSEHFTKVLFALLDETFDNIHGFYLDRNASMFETLADITADEASIPVGGKCATLAAQVKHIAFHLDYVEKYFRDPNPPQADWGEVWRTVNRVTPEEWQSIQSELRANYDRILTLFKTTPVWSSEGEIGNALAVVVHTAYHLGEIRQALCILRSYGQSK